MNELRDILDSITIISNYFEKFGNSSIKWNEFVSKVFRDENLGYRLDKKGGVHFYIDEEFERNRFSTLLMIDKQKYVAVHSAYEDAYRHFDSNPVDTKAAVRSLFESLEILVKQMVVTQNLNKRIVENDLKTNACRYTMAMKLQS